MTTPQSYIPSPPPPQIVYRSSWGGFALGAAAVIALLFVGACDRKAMDAWLAVSNSHTATTQISADVHTRADKIDHAADDAFSLVPPANKAAIAPDIAAIHGETTGLRDDSQKLTEMAAVLQDAAASIQQLKDDKAKAEADANSQWREKMALAGLLIVAVAIAGGVLTWMQNYTLGPALIVGSIAGGAMVTCLATFMAHPIIVVAVLLSLMVAGLLYELNKNKAMLASTQAGATGLWKWFDAMVVDADKLTDEGWNALKSKAESLFGSHTAAVVAVAKATPAPVVKPKSAPLTVASVKAAA